ncbi:uncharacterized protein LOC108109027 [Drosophila eugracilis]|uniref:uncharacterized protein LOC108109027 n=1 Tax=Drosophila eugracilis TaxID=29029 RepID=UPI001BD931CE|nr:uncharacterized protein LOC108109027 [Drosophila eugracilis]
MSSDKAFRVSPWLVLISFFALAQWSKAIPLLQDEALQELKDLNLTQAKLISDNSSAKCSLTPNLCDWQLHLYDGHAFSVPLVQAVQSTTTQSPSKTGQELFGLTHQDSGMQLFIVAEVEPKSRRELRKKRKLRRRVTFNHLSKQKFVLLVVQ